MLDYKMKKNIIFSLSFLLSSLLFTQSILAQEIEQEPKPPQIPEPSPTPKPIKSPTPEPIPAPFPEESNSEKIQRLTEENNKLKEQNSNLETKIVELTNLTENLHKIIMEQIKVIMNLVSKLKLVVFDKSFSSTIDF
jgi:hypothetical protein